MKISGFTIAKDAIKYDYPLKECIFTLLNLCDEVIIVVGKSSDGTLEEVKKLKNDKLKIITTSWDETLGYKVFSQQTNIAIENCTGKWGIYLQSDELIHEKDFEKLRFYIEQADSDNNIEGLLFNYRHFYGSYCLLNESRRFYRNEVRAIRLGIGIQSYNDAKGFRRNNKKLIVKAIPIYIYHYGWARDPLKMGKKYYDFQRFWHPEEEIKKIAMSENNIYHLINNYNLIPYQDSHPFIMQERIRNSKWSETNFQLYYHSKKRLTIKRVFFSFLAYLERKTWRIGYNKPYKRLIL